MKKALSIAVTVLLLIALAAAAPVPAEPAREAQTRTLTGLVIDRSDVPLADAVVYLKNTKTLAVKTYITDKSGAYRFPALSPNVDYQVYSEYKGQKSDTKTLSSFDARSNVTIHLRIDTRK